MTADAIFCDECRKTTSGRCGQHSSFIAVAGERRAQEMEDPLNWEHALMLQRTSPTAEYPCGCRRECCPTHAPPLPTPLSTPVFSEPQLFRVGDWVRFYQAGRLVISEVRYIRRTISGYTELDTDIGTVRTDAVMEYKR